MSPHPLATKNASFSNEETSKLKAKLKQKNENRTYAGTKTTTDTDIEIENFSNSFYTRHSKALTGDAVITDRDKEDVQVQFRVLPEQMTPEEQLHHEVVLKEKKDITTMTCKIL